MNSLKVFYKYLLVVFLMMLPIGSLLVQFLNHSFSEITHFEKQTVEIKKVMAWISSVDNDVEAVLKSPPQSEEHNSRLSNFKNNRLGLRELYFSSNLVLEGNENGLILNNVTLNLIPEIYGVLVDLNELPDRRSEHRTTLLEIKQNYNNAWTQIYSSQKKILQRSHDLAHALTKEARAAQEETDHLMLSYDQGASAKEMKAAQVRAREQLSFFWKTLFEKMQSETQLKLDEAKQSVLVYLVTVGLLLFISFGLTLNIFFDMSRRIKKLTEVTKNADPKKINIQTAQFGDDEIGDLAQSFETMSIELKQSFKQILQANEAKSSFVAVISHELRTPINGIIGTTNLIAETTLDEEQRLFVNTIKKSSDVLLSLINNILDISKIESGKMATELLTFDLDMLMKDIQDCFGFTAQQKNLRLSIDSQLDPSVAFRGDMHKIKQILFNLISNALKFTSKGEIKIKARLLAEDDALCRVSLAVQDQGIGIAPENLGKLFNDFVQTDSSMARKYGGTGLGLSLSKKFARLMGGDLYVKSEVGIGSEFWLEVTLEKTHGTTSMRTESANVLPLRPVTNDGGVKLKVLIAEDNDVNQMILQKYLKKWGYTFAIAKNGREAIDCLQQDANIGLILMDCQMPEVDGLEATRIIRKSSEHRIQFIPIIALTANALEEDRQNCLDAGMNSFISKPIDPVQLKKEIDLYNSSTIRKSA